jgi:hypothetical protein
MPNSENNILGKMAYKMQLPDHSRMNSVSWLNLKVIDSSTATGTTSYRNAVWPIWVEVQLEQILSETRFLRQLRGVYQMVENWNLFE